MKQTIRKFTSALRVLSSNPLVINAYVEKKGNQVRLINWGDDINYHFLKYLTKREITIYFDTPVTVALKMPNYLCIGSTLNYLTTPETIVWGAGVIDDALDLRAVPARVLAVRGPLSREYLISRGIACPEVYGDPALLIPYFYKPPSSRVSQSLKIGVVPHYKDKDNPALATIKQNHQEVEFLDIANYGKWINFIDRVCSCDTVFSSSLHGLIVAEAYGIPNYWINVSGNVIGNGFKFRDYFASIGKAITEPLVLDENSNLGELVAVHPWQPGHIDLKKLLAACPFQIKEAMQHEHPMDL